MRTNAGLRARWAERPLWCRALFWGVVIILLVLGAFACVARRTNSPWFQVTDREHNIGALVFGMEINSFFLALSGSVALGLTTLFKYDENRNMRVQEDLGRRGEFAAWVERLSREDLEPVAWGAMAKFGSTPEFRDDVRRLTWDRFCRYLGPGDDTRFSKRPQAVLDSLEAILADGWPERSPATSTSGTLSLPDRTVVPWKHKVVYSITLSGQTLDLTNLSFQPDHRAGQGESSGGSVEFVAKGEGSVKLPMKVDAGATLKIDTHGPVVETNESLVIDGYVEITIEDGQISPSAYQAQLAGVQVARGGTLRLSVKNCDEIRLDASVEGGKIALEG